MSALEHPSAAICVGWVPGLRSARLSSQIASSPLTRDGDAELERRMLEEAAAIMSYDAEICRRLDELNPEES